ncbi:MAG TPA: hypothetical protein VFK78_03340 [Gemmatimonadales bacterium]|nr:hypothetical protein [Gemmatimonadales bacterium]
MPGWASAQLVVGLVLSGGALLLALLRRRDIVRVAAEAACSAACAALFLAYWDIRLNARLSGWVIPLFLYAAIYKVVTTVETLRAEREDITETLPEPLPQVITLGHALLFIIPALYLGGVLTYRVWYPPVLSDALTDGAHSALDLQARTAGLLPLGGRPAAAMDSLRSYGFECSFKSEAEAPFDDKARDYCSKRSPDGPEVLIWKITLTHRHDSIINVHITMDTAEARRP